ncbi:MAG: slipin family protein [Verrucomicrobiota bacterium]
MMFILKRKLIRSYEKGLVFKNKEFLRVLKPGTHWIFDPLYRIRVDIVSERDPWIIRDDLDLIVRSGKLEGLAEVIDLQDDQRALVWIDKRFEIVLEPGLYALWKGVRDIRVEIIDAKETLLQRDDLPVILNAAGASTVLNRFSVADGQIGLLFRDGEFQTELKPGEYAAWKNVGKVQLFPVDMRERVLDVSGQEIMTADKVSLRMNAVVNWRVADARKSIEAVDDVAQALYREAQLALRAIVGTRELDSLLSDKNLVSETLEQAMSHRVQEFGIELISLGIKDIILPGDMKELLNKVIEAQKASEANVIQRREETAAMRSQMNTAKLMDGNPVLMRLKELEVLEKVAQSSKLNVVLGDKGLADKVVNLL